MPPCARAVWKWVFVFLVECRKEIVQEVPKILDTLYSYMQQSTHRPFLLHAVFLLTRFHQEPVISSLLQKSLFMDSDTVELWRSLGRSILGIRILRCLAEKLNRAGNDRPGTGSSTCERHDRQTALETLTITCAISEVVLALRSTEELRQLLPHLLPSLLRWASEMLGEERLLLLMSSWGELFLECQMHVEKPCRVFLSALELVLGKCMAQKWMQLLVNWAVWARLEDPLAYPEGVCLLSSRRELKNSVCIGARDLCEVTMVGLYIFLLGLVLPQFLMAFAWRSSVSIRGILLPMRRMRALIALCPCVRSQSRPVRSEDRGRVTGTVPAAVTTFVAIGTSLLKRLQDHEALCPQALILLLKLD
ncbi:maestro heat-like repeat-containing protein family member 2B [Harpia harpyja]|uniref:maestro heat-like repeat-containing protein family member 2B n=1 Tax=Harpia harpyja TaxID=202280 RepID=UPI0022B1B1E6|nr:maestro heat-like repeat-containing protein family member 2B [Harpia harpyja]